MKIEWVIAVVATVISKLLTENALKRLWWTSACSIDMSHICSGSKLTLTSLISHIFENICFIIALSVWLGFWGHENWENNIYLKLTEMNDWKSRRSLFAKKRFIQVSRCWEYWQFNYAVLVSKINDSSLKKKENLT